MIWNPFEANKRIEELEKDRDYWCARAQKDRKSILHMSQTMIPAPKRDAKGRFCK